MKRPFAYATMASVIVACSSHQGAFIAGAHSTAGFVLRKSGGAFRAGYQGTHKAGVRQHNDCPRLDFTVTGGTGRFARATGNGQVEFYCGGDPYNDAWYGKLKFAAVARAAMLIQIGREENR